MIQSIAFVFVQTWLRTPFSDLSNIFFPLEHRNLQALISINQLDPFSRTFLEKPPIRRELNARSGNVTQQIQLEMSCPLCPFLFTCICGLCRHHWPYIDICVHLFTCTLCCACRIVLLDCTLIIALEREHSQCVVCVQSRCFFSPLLQRELWTPWLYAGGRTVVYLSLYATPEEIMFTWSSAELWHQNNEVVSWRQL